VNVGIHLLEQIQHDEWEFHVENICGHQVEGKQFQLQMKWLGFEEETWEPFESIATDVKDLVKKCVLSTD
jgi:hypothetical protein